MGKKEMICIVLFNEKDIDKFNIILFLSIVIVYSFLEHLEDIYILF
jgi:hypothetical protein